MTKNRLKSWALGINNLDKYAQTYWNMIQYYFYINKKKQG